MCSYRASDGKERPLSREEAKAEAEAARIAAKEEAARTIAKNQVEAIRRHENEVLCGRISSACREISTEGRMGLIWNLHIGSILSGRRIRNK